MGGQAVAFPPFFYLENDMARQRALILSIIPGTQHYFCWVVLCAKESLNIKHSARQIPAVSMHTQKAFWNAAGG
jgi:hypothetical protein